MDDEDMLDYSEQYQNVEQKRKGGKKILKCICCDKKSILNGYCSIHVGLGRDIPKKKKPLTQEEIEIIKKRRADKMAEINDPIINRLAKINHLKSKLEYSSIPTEEHYYLDKLIKEHNDIIKNQNNNLDIEIEELKAYYKKKYQDENIKNNYSDTSFDFNNDGKHNSSTRSRTYKGQRNWVEVDSYDINKNKAFKSLNIESTNDINIIKRAYKDAALLYHPDRNVETSSSEMFREVNEAFIFLQDDLNL